MNKDWECLLKNEFEKDYFKSIISFINNERKNKKIIYPKNEDIYSAFEISPKDIKVIIVGQDPYHNEGQANGLAFSVKKEIKIPPSLVNIYKEIEKEYNKKMPSHGDLNLWKNQGVFLLNTSLTVEKNKPSSHSKIGWQTFTDYVIKTLSDQYENNVFILWGNHAKAKESLINRENNLILTSAHPSPFSVTKFLGNNHFSLTNKYLIEKNKKPIDWFNI